MTRWDPATFALLMSQGAAGGWLNSCSPAGTAAQWHAACSGAAASLHTSSAACINPLSVAAGGLAAHRTVSATCRCLKPDYCTLQAIPPSGAAEGSLEAKQLPLMKPTQAPSVFRAAAAEGQALEAGMQPASDSLLQRGQGQSFAAGGGQALAGVSSNDCAVSFL